MLGVLLMLAGVGIVDIGGSAGRELFYRYDLWSWAAEACAAILITGLTALLVGSYLSNRCRVTCAGPWRSASGSRCR